STRAELLRYGVRDVAVIPQAIDVAPVGELRDPSGPLRVIVIGRLTPAKFVEEALRVFERVQRRHPDARLEVVGGGDEHYRARLEALGRRLGLDGVTFHGRVSHDRKRALLVAAHVHLFTSHREGWGLTVSEAAAVGTPSVGYDAPGVRDSIANPRLLAPIGDVDTLAARLLALMEAPPSERDAIRREAWERARALSWERTTNAFEAAVA
ncbi:MAG: glycosyltransferase family 4 protein, partial [Actinomycetota bacterium]|nr:glycosyltransferase family 4 protein [Actinomycetota bacterium]